MISLPWAQFKVLLAGNEGSANYIPTGLSYIVWLDNNGSDFHCFIDINTDDHLDFSDNFKPFITNTYNPAANTWSTKITDGTDTATVTAVGELNVLATTQPGVDIGDVTINNSTGAAAVNIQDGGNSITVDAVDLDIRNLVFATDKADVSGSVIALDAPTLAALESITVQNGAGAGAVNIQDGGNSITVDGTVELGATTLSALESITVQNGSGASAVNIQDGGNSITVDSNNLDIRDLVFSTDKVDVSGSVIALDATTLAALENTSVTVTNTSGAGAVNIQDGGNSITVDANNLDVALSTRATEVTQLANNAQLILANASLDDIEARLETFDTNAGVTGANTLRTSSNITRNGTELSYNDGASDANTLRTSTNIKFDGTTPDRNFGTVGTNTLRTAAELGNATGSANFGVGVTGAQTLRTTSNITRNGTELSYGSGVSDVNTVRTNSIISNATGPVDYNHGIVGAQTQRVVSAPMDGSKATYRASTSAVFGVATSATDIFTITGSATKTIRVLKLWVAGAGTTSGIWNIFLRIRSTANTGGTSAAVTPISNDSTNASATATVLSYSANPTLGTLVGTIGSYKVIIPTPTTAVMSIPYEILFGNLPGQAIVLRGTSQVLTINLNATTISGGGFLCGVEWTEE